MVANHRDMHISMLQAPCRCLGSCQVTHWYQSAFVQFRGQYNPFGSLAELQLRMQRSMSLRSQRSSLQPIAVNSQNGFSSHSRHLLGNAGIPASSSPSSTFLGARQLGRVTSTDRLSRTSSTSTVPDSICIDALDYSPALKMLGVVLADGRCAICRTADTGLAPAEQLEFSHWICGVGSGATCLCIAPDAQLIAVGMTSGEVALYKLYSHKGGRFSIDGNQAEGPVRTVSLLDWGYGPEATGSVAELKWSPDNRAFAVSPLPLHYTMHVDRQYAVNALSCRPLSASVALGAAGMQAVMNAAAASDQTRKYC